MNKHILLRPRSNSGFTVTELLVVVLLAGIIAAIAAPGWLGYLDRRKLVSSQDTLYQALLNAQTRAQQTAGHRGVAIRDNGGTVEWSSFSGDSTTASGWEDLDEAVRIDSSIGLTPDANGAYAIAFNHKGNLVDGSIVNNGFILTTVAASTTGSGVSRGVVADTLLGSLRKTN